jgi:Protein phosphatase 2C
MLSFIVEDSGSNPGSEHNDDCWGATGPAVWILDGATGLGKERLLRTAETDAQWFVKAVDSELRAADWTQPTEALLRSVMRNVAARFHDEAVGLVDQAALWPFASFAMVRMLADQIEFINLGDCRILWKMMGFDEVSAFGWSRVTRLDHEVVAEITKLHLAGQTDNEVVRRAIGPKIQANRAKKNRPGGYWILDVPGEGLPYLQTMRLEAATVQCVLLCTDGYYRAVDTYQLQTDQSLVEQSAKIGIGQMVQMIRTSERSDERCLKFPRIKPSDDATCVLLSVGGNTR